ncbi:Carboxylic ester hydrolase [Mycena chlorophos]|uniref:Carboxylic ester hydrolase n=1 Tax=Mycena chlorophos TaxID=658473 RepID=A0A8H6VU97_MYCCL|nr:Carboxylic ester hydrolase [Mycena chlorophos]
MAHRDSLRQLLTRDIYVQSPITTTTLVVFGLIGIVPVAAMVAVTAFTFYVSIAALVEIALFLSFILSVACVSSVTVALVWVAVVDSVLLSWGDLAQAAALSTDAPETVAEQLLLFLLTGRIYFILDSPSTRRSYTKHFQGRLTDEADSGCCSYPLPPCIPLLIRRKRRSRHGKPSGGTLFDHVCLPRPRPPSLVAMEVAVALLSRLFAGWLQPVGNATLQANCLALKTNFTFENTAILDVAYLSGPSKLAPLGICETGKVRHSVPMCRVQFHTNTSAESGIDAEMWLPDEWNGRFMGLGNRGLTGCIRYDQLEYSSSTLHFATVSTNGGHDGDTAQPLLKNPESLLDYASRAVHTEAVIGKQLLEAYYGGPANHSYYMGCSQGGRQGVQSALQHPDDFDGILAGAPTVDFSNLMHWTAMQHAHVAGNSSISPAAWKQISKEVLRQCDALDGVVDGIITEPDSCDFRPESLLCSEGQPKGAFCLTVAQVDALRNIYAPMYGAGGKLISARFDPGAESSPLLGRLYGDAMLSHPASWLKYVVLNGSEVQGKDYGVTKNKAIRAATGEEMDTSSGDFSAFRERGGRLITYHGRADGILPSGRSKQYYDHVSRTNSLPTLDDFYRLFLIPGMDHCENGPGAFKFGQSATAAAPTNNSTHDIISALVDWVENGVAPESIVGTDVKGKEREHCRYPMKSVWNVEAGRYVCRV